MAGRRVLIIDDDKSFLDVVGLVLRGEEYEPITAATGDEGIQQLTARPPDLVVLDVNLPDQDGFSVLREIRRHSNVSVLMLTGRGDASDIVQGLDTGADDYLVKPFKTDEFLARVRALLRRTPVTDQLLTAAGGQLTIDMPSRTVNVRGEPVDLTPTEYQLLVMMARRPGTVFDHETLLRNVWGDDYVKDTAYLKVYIWHLRRKLEEDPHEPRIVMTEWGVGYRLAP